MDAKEGLVKGERERENFSYPEAIINILTLLKISSCLKENNKVIVQSC